MKLGVVMLWMLTLTMIITAIAYEVGRFHHRQPIDIVFFCPQEHQCQLTVGGTPVIVPSPEPEPTNEVILN